jgi:anti-sigma B factor antagonist
MPASKSRPSRPAPATYSLDRLPAPVNFDVNTEQLGDSTFVIALTGEVDLYTAPEFKQQLLDAISKGAKNVVVDLTGTTFIDSTTLGVLVGGIKRLRGQEGQLSLVCSDRNIAKIFEITGLDRVFQIYPARDEALAAAGASTQS